MSWSDLVGEVGGFYRDIEVAKASRNGSESGDVRPESIPDQTSVGTVSPTGPGSSVGVAGVALNTNVLITTGLVLAGLATLKYVRG